MPSHLSNHPHPRLLLLPQLNESINVFQRKFVGEVRRCDEMDRRLRFFAGEIEKLGIPIPDNTNTSERAPKLSDVTQMEVWSLPLRPSKLRIPVPSRYNVRSGMFMACSLARST